MMHSTYEPRGITLLISVILASVVLSVSLSLLDITYKQVLLASSAKQSQYAFYAADSAMECALYWDQQKDAFDFVASSYLSSGITCADSTGATQTIVMSPSSWPSSPVNYSSVISTTRTSYFHLPCTGGGDSGVVTVTKTNTGTTNIFATGYSNCSATDPRRIERGLKVNY